MIVEPGKKFYFFVWNVILLILLLNKIQKTPFTLDEYLKDRCICMKRLWYHSYWSWDHHDPIRGKPEKQISKILNQTNIKGWN
jgi:hypothetical protein